MVATSRPPLARVPPVQSLFPSVDKGPGGRAAGESRAEAAGDAGGSPAVTFPGPLSARATGNRRGLPQDHTPPPPPRSTPVVPRGTRPRPSLRQGARPRRLRARGGGAGGEPVPGGGNSPHCRGFPAPAPPGLPAEDKGGGGGGGGRRHVGAARRRGPARRRGLR